MRIRSLTLTGLDTSGEIVVALLVAGLISFVAFVVIYLVLVIALGALMQMERGNVMAETQGRLLTEVEVEHSIAKRNPRLHRLYSNILPNAVVATGFIFVMTFVYNLFFTNHRLFLGF